MCSCPRAAFSRCVGMRTVDSVFQVLRTEKEKQDVSHRERIEDLLDKQSRELQDLGESPGRGHGVRWGQKSESPPEPQRSPR